MLLWELVTREVPFADLSNMEIGMKVRELALRAPDQSRVQIVFEIISQRYFAVLD